MAGFGSQLELRLTSRTTLRPGDQCRWRGRRGRYTFHRLVVDAAGNPKWVDLTREGKLYAARVGEVSR